MSGAHRKEGEKVAVWAGGDEFQIRKQESCPAPAVYLCHAQAIPP